jgi:hypothetical protein
VEPGIVFVELDVLGLDRQLPAPGYRIPGVHGEVQEDLLDLRRVRLHPPQAPGGLRGEVDVLPDETAQHRLDLDYDRVEVEDLRREHLLAAEGEELLGEVGGMVGRLLDQSDPLT